LLTAACVKQLVKKSLVHILCAALAQFLSEISGFCGSFDDTTWNSLVIDEFGGDLEGDYYSLIEKLTGQIFMRH
jgi:hypothetical protein